MSDQTKTRVDRQVKPGEKAVQTKIPEELHREFKAEAARQGLTVQDAIAEAIRRFVDEAHTGTKGGAVFATS